MLQISPKKVSLHRIDNFDGMKKFASCGRIVMMSEPEHGKGYDSSCTSGGEIVDYGSDSHLILKEHNNGENMK